MPVLRHLHRLRSVAPLRAGAVLVALGAIIFAGQASFSASSTATYTVRSGDSLWAIAADYHLTVAQLASANGLDPARVLLIGTHLVIPGSGGSTSTSTGAQTTVAAVSSSSTAGGHQFCSTFTVPAGSEPLPAGLTDNPSRLGLRPYFVEWADDYGISPALLEAVAWQESGWQEGVVSSAQAVGVGQLLPSTAAFVSGQLIGSPLSISSASDNIRMSARYLAYLLSATGSTCAAIASYNEGLINYQAYGVLNEVVPYVQSVAELVPQFS